MLYSELVTLLVLLGYIGQYNFAINYNGSNQSLLGNVVFLV